MTQEHAIALDDFSVYRGNRLLVKNISFALPYGRYLELQGQNGCGKTTLLKTLAKQDPDTRILTNGSSIFYFGHQSGFRPELSVAEQLVLSLQLYQSPADAGQILKRVGLTHQVHVPIRQLSQ